MLCYARIANNPRLLQNFTGLNINAFAKLHKSFERAYEVTLDEQDAARKQPRKRQRGGGRKPVLSTAADKLLYILFYYKFYPTQEVQGFFFGFGKAQANEWIKRLTPVVNRALGYELQLPARQPADVAQILAACPELTFIIDGTERPIQRPKDKARQQQYYSGKKKQHTVKNLVITEKQTKKVKALSTTVEGKRHDKALADETGYGFPAGSVLYKHTGFQGYEPAGITTKQPQKKPRGRELTAAEKAENREISRERIGIEHSLGGVKLYRIVREALRQHLEGFADLVMENACGLHNLRLVCRQGAGT
jgi:hypothetical protein